MTLLNGNDGQYCDGKSIDVGIFELGSNKVCHSKRKPQILAGVTGIWSSQNLRDKCKKTLFDPDKVFEVQVRTHTTQDPFCPKNVELEILDLNTNQPRYFCSDMEDLSGGYTTASNWRKHEAKEERCPSS